MKNNSKGEMEVARGAKYYLSSCTLLFLIVLAHQIKATTQSFVSRTYDGTCRKGKKTMDMNSPDIPLLSSSSSCSQPPSRRSSLKMSKDPFTVLNKNEKSLDEVFDSKDMENQRRNIERINSVTNQKSVLNAALSRQQNEGIKKNGLAGDIMKKTSLNGQQQDGGTTDEDNAVAIDGDWRAYFDEGNTGLIYYFNVRSGVSQWKKPYKSFPMIVLTEKQLKLHKRRTNELLMEARISTDNTIEETQQQLARNDDVAVQDGKDLWSLARDLVFPAQSHGERKSDNDDSYDPTKPLATQGRWKAYLDNRSDCIYYYNEETRKSQWFPPTTTFPKIDRNKVVQQHQQYEQMMKSNAGTQYYEVSTPKVSPSKVVENLPPLAQEGKWSSYYDDVTDSVYFYNVDTGVSQWDIPTPTFPTIQAVVKANEYLRASKRGKEVKASAVEEDDENLVELVGILLFQGAKTLWNTVSNTVAEQVQRLKDQQEEENKRQRLRNVMQLDTDSTLKIDAKWMQQAFDNVVSEIEEVLRTATVFPKFANRNEETDTDKDEGGATKTQDNAKNNDWLKNVPTLPPLNFYPPAVFNSRTFSISAIEKEVKQQKSKNPINFNDFWSSLRPVKHTSRSTSTSPDPKMKYALHLPKTYEIKRLPTFSLSAIERNKKTKKGF